ncbi:MAG: hypothetical protein LBL95_04985, partial [Deltaproteobacteria bacterium]|nr:hypothetical protein [Deltaproteobacteria bacterium]
MALLLALALLVAALTLDGKALAQEGLGFAPDEQVPDGRTGEDLTPEAEPAQRYDLPDWVPRYPNSDRPYWLP